jgi:hypothetical protein
MATTTMNRTTRALSALVQSRAVSVSNVTPGHPSKTVAAG